MFCNLPCHVKETIYSFLNTQDLYLRYYESIPENDAPCDFKCDNRTPFCTEGCRLYYLQPVSPRSGHCSSECSISDLASRCDADEW